MRYVIFGESHGPAIGVVLEGAPAGLELNLEDLQRELARRAPGQGPLSTARREADRVQVLSGLFEGRTTGAPLTLLIANSDQHSGDYESIRYTPRPSHGDYAGYVKSGGCQDYRGGGHFSGRLTAPLVAAGAVAKQLLGQKGVWVGAHISSIYGISDVALEDTEDLRPVAQKAFPVLDDAKGEEMQAAILQAKEEGDSVGGAVECAVTGLPAGLGAPDFGCNAEGIFSQHLFAVPAVKGIDFGAGVAFAYLRGSEANDPFVVRGGNIVTKTNHAGGINGGITNGMPVTFEVTLRPTPSIALPQESVDLRTGEEVELEIKGRHDPCIVHRALPAIEAAAALAAWELMEKGGRAL
jgi:chorismate synthase